MQKKQFEFGLKGLLIGLLLGAIIGFLSLNQIKKSLRSQSLPFIVIGCAIAFAISGYGIGSKMGREHYIEERTGIDRPAKDGFLKDGRFWIGVTKWIDNRDNKEYTLLTGKPNDKQVKNLISSLNGRCFVIHESTSASKESVPKLHNTAKQQVWKAIKENFNENSFDELHFIPTVS
jgi:hypothetical protein